MTHTEPRHSIAVDERSLAIRLAISGFWTPVEMAAMLQELDAAMQSLVQRSLPFILLCDMRDMLVQDRATADCIRQHFVRTQYVTLRGIAIFGASTLAMIQHRRLYGAQEPQFFDSEAEAVQWAKLAALSRAPAPRNLPCGMGAAVAG